MPTILTNTNSNDSPSIASARPSTTEPRGPHTSAPAAGNQSNKDDTESSHASVDNAPPVMPDNLETDNAPHSGASAIDDESHAHPQGNTPLTPVHDTLHHTTGENHGRPTQAGIDPGASQAGAFEAPFKAADVKGEDKVTKNQDHTCGCQSQKLTGWAAVEKTLTDFDREEVGGYKEDIDSLLTFAGLYSGVLTAFVIVSFTQLSEDTATESLRVLRIIANQTSGNPVSSSLTLTDPSPFQPSLAAKRVNVLWFASLVISLSTASFSILVKQWLRSYMAFASSSPQGALRVRHFRRAGLEAWRVFRIASMLPFLLQISLALFFVGLCFFTVDVDPTIGNTALPLVCAWAFLFLTVTLSPIFSANCPYKTPAVSPVTTTLRCYIGHMLVRWGRALLTGLLIVSTTFFIIIIVVVDMVIWAITPRRWFGTPKFLGVVKFLRDTVRIWDESFKQVPQEEADVRIRESEDMAILITADAIQANTELDVITLEAALHQTKPSWEETVVFLMQIISNRAPLSTDLTDPGRVQRPMTIIDCSSLSARTRENIIDLLQRYVIDQLPDASELKIPAGQYLPVYESSPLIKKSILILWAMVIHVSFYDEHAQLPEKLPASVARAIDCLHCPNFRDRHSDESRSWFQSDVHRVALAMCCRINHDGTGLRGKIQFTKHVLSFYPSAATSRRFIGHPDNTSQSLLATVLRDAAQCVANDLRQEILAPGHTISATGLEIAIRAVMALCTLSQRYQNRRKDIRLELEYENILEPLVVEAFKQGTWRARKAILNVLCPIRGFYYAALKNADEMRYCKFLRNKLEVDHQSDLGHGLMSIILKFAAIPVATLRSWEDIIRRLVVIITLLESYNPESRLTNRLLWCRVFFVLSRQMHSLPRLSSAQDFFELPIYLPDSEVEEDPFSFIKLKFSLSRLVKTCGSKIDEMLKPQEASASGNSDCVPVNRHNPSDQLELEHRNRTTQSCIPDYFCLTLGRLADCESSRSSIWTAKHLRNISTEERNRIVEEEEREMETIGIDAIIADARESYIE